MFIDHITVAGPDLDELRAGLSVAGVVTEYGGAHGNGITHMALAGFGDGSYLEIVAPLQADGCVALWHNFRLPRAGGTAWTIAADNVSSELSRVRKLGIEAAGPLVIRREKPNGVIGQWELGYLANAQPGGILPFVIHDLSERSVRVRPTPSLAPILAGWSAIILAVCDVAAAARQFQRVYGWSAPVREGGLHHFQGTPVYLSSPPDHLNQFGESPCAGVLRTTTAALIPGFRYSATSRVGGRTVRWLGLPWKSMRIGVESLL